VAGAPLLYRIITDVEAGRGIVDAHAAAYLPAVELAVSLMREPSSRR